MNETANTNAVAVNHNRLSSPRTASASALPEGRLIAEPPRALPGQNGEAKAEPAATVVAKRGPRTRRIVGAIAALAIAAGVATYYVKYVAPYESTDDAFIEADVTPIAPQVAGRVARVLVMDNQPVKQGDVLLEIDSSDYRASLDAALANLAAARSRLQQAHAQSAVDQAKVGQEQANVSAAQAEAKRAEADLKRYRAVGELGVSASQLDLAATQARSSQAQVEAARNKELAAESQASLDQATIQTATAEVRRSQAALRQAQLNLSYTRITAPVSGRVTHRGVEPGVYVQPGQALLAIVPRQVWVVANFKETQLKDMRPGQPVAVKVDAYPQATFAGHVDSIQSGSGARFSLLPPENASGNYVKVVQRVPVKILLDAANDSRYVLGPGMSAEPEVRVK